MRVIGIILILIGFVGLFFSTLMFGDIGIACGVAAITALLSGIGFILANSKINKLIKGKSGE